MGWVWARTVLKTCVRQTNAFSNAPWLDAVQRRRLEASDIPSLGAGWRLFRYHSVLSDSMRLAGAQHTALLVKGKW
jgi:hypothetical protein